MSWIKSILQLFQIDCFAMKILKNYMDMEVIMERFIFNKLLRHIVDNKWKEKIGDLRISLFISFSFCSFYIFQYSFKKNHGRYFSFTFYPISSTSRLHLFVRDVLLLSFSFIIFIPFLPSCLKLIAVFNVRSLNFIKFHLKWIYLIAFTRLQLL